MAHRIGGRKLSRKQGPRLSLYKNLAVSVIRYERVKTTQDEIVHAITAGVPTKVSGVPGTGSEAKA